MLAFGCADGTIERFQQRYPSRVDDSDQLPVALVLKYPENLCLHLYHFDTASWPGCLHGL
jgi:hypothetical protein